MAPPLRVFRVIAAWALCWQFVAQVQAGDRLGSEIAAVIQSAEFKHAHWGILVVDAAGGQTVYELNADHLFGGGARDFGSRPSF
jgi:D-alanyl-D-alanine carboxypeptidase